MKWFLIPIFLFLVVGFVYGASSTESIDLLPEVPKVCIDINKATFDELQSIAHIGIDEAISIMNFRRIVDFRFVDDLGYISGINISELQEIKAEGLACVPSSSL